MDDTELRNRLRECVSRIEELAKSKGCEMTLEFELCAVRWGAELAATARDDGLTRTVIREAEELGAMLESDLAPDRVGALAPAG